MKNIVRILAFAIATSFSVVAFADQPAAPGKKDATHATGDKKKEGAPKPVERTGRGTDRARRSYDASRMYRSEVSQQGRVTVEADANEEEETRAELKRNAARSPAAQEEAKKSGRGDQSRKKVTAQPRQ